MFLILTDTKSRALSAFWCKEESLYINTFGSSEIEIQFLPFNLGLRQCSLLFLNDTAGEFLYSIEAEATLPLPSLVPFSHPGRGLRVTSAMAAQQSRGTLREDDRIIYLYCDADKKCVEELSVPVLNSTKQDALSEY